MTIFTFFDLHLNQSSRLCHVYILVHHHQTESDLPPNHSVC